MPPISMSNKPLVNLKCTPANPDWPSTKEMHTADFGPFLPGEVKRVREGAKVDKLLRSGEFEVTDDEPNSEEIRLEASKARIAEENGEDGDNEPDE